MIWRISKRGILSAPLVYLVDKGFAPLVDPRPALFLAHCPPLRTSTRRPPQVIPTLDPQPLPPPLQLLEIGDQPPLPQQKSHLLPAVIERPPKGQHKDGDQQARFH